MIGTAWFVILKTFQTGTAEGTSAANERFCSGAHEVVQSEGRYSVGRVQEAHSDGSAHLLWWNSKDGKDGKCSPTQKWYRAYQGRDAELGEKFTITMKGDPKKRLWDLVSRANMVQTFKWPSRERQDATPAM
jgi:hypothetical protein